MNLDFITSDEIFVIDTETTGLGSTAEAVQIAIVDYYGNIRFDQLIKPTYPIPIEVSTIHGILNSDVEKAQTLHYYWDMIRHQWIDGKVLTGYNVNFDMRILTTTLTARDPEIARTRMPTPLMILDVMLLVKHHFRLEKFVSLKKAVELLDLPLSSGDEFHTARTDAVMTAMVLREVLSL